MQSTSPLSTVQCGSTDHTAAIRSNRSAYGSLPGAVCLPIMGKLCGYLCLTLGFVIAACTGTETPTGGATGGGGTGTTAGASGLATTGGATTGGSRAAGGADGTGGSTANRCDASGLVWKTGSKTNFTSYPAPGSPECIDYSGCLYEGQFAACNQTEPEAWVAAHNIVAVFPDFNALKLHDLCLKSGTKTIVVTVLDTCADSDCSGCCTANQGTADELIDVESYTDARWGVPDGSIQWADLGPTTTSGCL
jgi:hypothetical protein